MRLLRFVQNKVSDNDWFFGEVYFSRINLLVGDSATGKTRFLNGIVNFLRLLVADRIMYQGDWDADFEIQGTKYNYKLETAINESSPNELLILFEELINLKDNITLFHRDKNEILWQNKNLPKLSSDKTCFSLLKEEDLIKPLFQNLKNIVSREFYGDELSKNFALGALLPYIEKVLINSKNIQRLTVEEINFHNKLNILKKIDANGFIKVIDLIKTAFPFIEKADILNVSQVIPDFNVPIQAPVFCIKERNISKWIPCNDISSGMQKLFLLILDIYLLRDAGILFIDEYENSLGINAINFLPDLIDSISDNCQFIITSHHPYAINTIPIEAWKVFHRKGTDVSVTPGKELKEKYSKSKQEYFVQLINDPLYKGGIE
jgi:predicted ATPase